MPDKDQTMMFNSNELSLIKNTFAENDVLIYTLRKLFLDFELTDAEKNLINMSVTPEVYAVLKKRILPDITPDLPLGQLPSLHTNLTEMLKVQSYKEMEPHFESKEIQITYLEERFAVLNDIITDNGVRRDTIRLKSLGELTGKDAEQRFVDITAYLFLLGYIDPMFSFIKALAGSKDETPEKQKERLTRNSSK